jgi:hypothetical protein
MMGVPRTYILDVIYDPKLSPEDIKWIEAVHAEREKVNEVEQPPANQDEGLNRVSTPDWASRDAIRDLRRRDNKRKYGVFLGSLLSALYCDFNRFCKPEIRP